MIVSQMSEHITVITDRLGVNMTLVKGSRSAVLIDTGYGLEPIEPMLRSLTELPVRVVLTHAHHDHALGAMQFQEVWAFPEEKPVYETYTCRERRLKVLGNAGIDPAERPQYLEASMPVLSMLESGTMDLGGVHLECFKVPGHTPGSAMFTVAEDHVLISGDNWNPETWLFFPEALPLNEYKRNMLEFMRVPFDSVICSHRQGLFDREKLEAFLHGIRVDADLEGMPFPDMPKILVGRMQTCEDQVIAFDLEKCDFGELYGSDVKQRT